MLLRESSRRSGEQIDLSAVADPSRESGLTHAAHLNALVETCIGRRWDRIDAVCDEAERVMGADAVRDALIVAAGFNGITRVADATGIPLDPSTAANTAAFRRDFSVDAFDYAAKSARFDLT